LTLFVCDFDLENYFECFLDDDFFIDPFISRLYITKSFLLFPKQDLVSNSFYTVSNEENVGLYDENYVFIASHLLCAIGPFPPISVFY